MKHVVGIQPPKYDTQAYAEDQFEREHFAPVPNLDIPYILNLKENTP